MAFGVGVALPLFVGASLASLSTTLLVAGRRTAEALVLAFFLTLVAVNFVGDAFTAATGDPRGSEVALVATALDPFFLLLFVTRYPVRHRTRAATAVLALVGVSTVAAIALVVGEGAAAIVGASPTFGRRIVVANLAFAYIATFLSAMRTVGHAPTPLLARRAAWVLSGVGAAVIPRLRPVRYELGITHIAGLPLNHALAEGVALALLGCVLAAGWMIARAPRARGGVSSRMIRRALAPGLLLYVATVLLSILPLFGVPSGPLGTVVFSVRWPVFAAILVHGLLAFDDLAFERRTARALPLVGGALGALAAGLATGAVLSPRVTGTGIVAALALAVALATFLPATAAARAAVRSASGGLPRDADRRLELYRAALEAAWARGPPTTQARTRLEKDRAAFEVTADEARALEHVIATALRPKVPELRAGDEPAPGLLVEERLGAGAQGIVFAARRYPSGEPVVVKELRAAARDPREGRARLLAEARPLLALDHPRIVRLLDVHVGGGRYLLVMRRVDGGSLSARLARGPLAEPEVERIVADVLEALAAAHAKGVVHRDVKPSNILLDPNGRALLTDFGLALSPAVEDETTVSNLLALGAPVGTVAYMAPEQARGGRANASSDLYATGLVAFEALMRRPALDVRGLPLLTALNRVSSPRLDLADVPPSWRDWLARATAIEPRERFASALEMRNALLTAGRPRPSAPP